MTRYAEIRRNPKSMPEEAYDRFAQWVEGPVNRRAERVMKSKLFLAPLGLGWTLWARSLLALRDRDLSRLYKTPDPLAAKKR